MKRLLSGLLSASLIAASAVPAYGAGAGMTLLGAGAKSVAAAGCSYTGAGDVDSNWASWWGLRAFSAATCGTALINVCLAADAACGDLSSDASTGALVVTAVGGSLCNVVTCTVKTAYDKAAGGCDVTQAVEALRPVLTFASGKPALQTSGSGHGLTATCSGTTSQPYTLVVLANAISGGYPFGTSDNAFGNPASINNGGSYFFCPQGAGIFAFGVSTGTWYGVSEVYNGASSNLQVDASANTGDCGSGAAGKYYTIGAQGYNLAGNFDGYVREAGLNTTDLSGKLTTLNSNMTSGY